MLLNIYNSGSGYGTLVLVHISNAPTKFDAAKKTRAKECEAKLVFVLSFSPHLPWLTTLKLAVGCKERRSNSDTCSFGPAAITSRHQHVTRPVRRLWLSCRGQSVLFDSLLGIVPPARRPRMRPSLLLLRSAPVTVWQKGVASSFSLHCL